MASVVEAQLEELMPRSGTQNVSLYGRASGFSLDSINLGAERTRTILNKRWVEAGALIELHDGKFKVAYKVSQQQSDKIFRIHFAAHPTVLVRNDTVHSDESLMSAATSDVKRIIFGFHTGEFESTTQQARVLALPVEEDGSLTKVEAVIWRRGELAPTNRTATVMTLDKFIKDFPPVAVPIGVSRDTSLPVREFKYISKVLDAVNLLTGEGDQKQAKLSEVELFLAELVDSAVQGKQAVTKALKKVEDALKSSAGRQGAKMWETLAQVH